MEFFEEIHSHPLVLDEYYHGGEGDFCCMCEEPILPSPLAQSVYLCTRGMKSSDDDDDVDCDKMFVHKSCAELPLILTDSYMHPQHPITLIKEYYFSCSTCHEYSVCKLAYNCRPCTKSVSISVCLKCVTSPLVYHPSHNQHPLTILQRPACFRCAACGKEAADSSSCKCTVCPFWIHMSCAILSSSFQSQFHRHPLLLAYSFPQQYLKFDHHKCIICKDDIKRTLWLYYCAGCRIFVHIQCANAKATTRPVGEFSDLVHLPAPDESSLNLLRQSFMYQMMINQGEGDALTWSFSPISTVTAADVAGPNKEVIHHWSHDQHPLILRNKCSTMTVEDDNEDDSTIILCDGCTYPINSSNTCYYECHVCKYFLHRYCAELPKQMQPYKFQPFEHRSLTHVFTKISSSNLFLCHGCDHLKSGIHIAADDGRYKLDIGCAMLPTKIKHEAHEHPLTQASLFRLFDTCDACGQYVGSEEGTFRCDGCCFYLHIRCALRPHKLKHRWDPHPLTLITPENIVEEHPHDFNCEHCSEDIDTTSNWYYHCSLCDLSYHMACINEFYRYSHINFSVSETKIDQQLHQHGLTLVFNKRKRCCGKCHGQLFYMPILQCTTCNFIICLACVDASQFVIFRLERSV